MILEKVTQANLEYAVGIQEELFRGESGRANLEDSLKDGADYGYYLLYEEGTCVGIIGLYRYPEDADSAWLGWFGILEQYRRKHLGTAAIGMFEEMAAEQGYLFARLYTDAENNDAAIAFYKSNGYICEPYLNPQDPACQVYKTLIFSKSLTDEALVPWNSRTIHLTEQMAKEAKYSRQKRDPGGSQGRPSAKP